MSESLQTFTEATGIVQEMPLTSVVYACPFFMIFVAVLWILIATINILNVYINIIYVCVTSTKHGLYFYNINSSDGRLSNSINLKLFTRKAFRRLVW